MVVPVRGLHSGCETEAGLLRDAAPVARRCYWLGEHFKSAGSAQHKTRLFEEGTNRPVLLEGTRSRDREVPSLSHACMKNGFKPESIVRSVARIVIIEVDVHSGQSLAPVPYL